MTTPRSGRCACGSISYTVGADPLAVLNCHCRDCQRASGTGFSTVAVFPASALDVQGAPKWRETTADNGATVRRGFCAECGSPLLSSSSGLPDFVIVKVASFDDPAALRPTLDIWTASAQPWTAMDVSTKKYDRDVRR